MNLQPGLLLGDINEVGIGVVVRNSLAALLERIPMPSSVVILETLAARRAKQLVREIGLHNPIFQGDSKISINTYDCYLSNFEVNE